MCFITAGPITGWCAFGVNKLVSGVKPKELPNVLVCTHSFSGARVVQGREQHSRLNAGLRPSPGYENMKADLNGSHSGHLSRQGVGGESEFIIHTGHSG